ncbi:MAG: threonine/serine exporter ThrE family protein [Beutenbergiaceae bacterium]
MNDARPPAQRPSARERARRFVAPSGPPTMPVGMRRPASGLSRQDEGAVLDMALRTGEAMIATGAPIADATAALHKIMDGFAVTNAQIDITFTAITASVEHNADPVTRVRVIEDRTSDYSRLSGLVELVDDIGAGRLDIPTAQRCLDEVLTSPHPYRRWIVTLALGAMAASISVLFGGGWQIALVAAGTTAIIDRALRFGRRRGLPHLFQQVLGAMIATIVAVLLLWGQNLFGWDAQLLPSSLVVAAGIVVLLAGLSLVGAAQDAISGFPLTASARSFEVVISTIGLVLGIAVVLDLGVRLGVPLQVVDYAAVDVSTPLRIASGAVAAGAWAVASYTRPRVVLVVMVVAAAAMMINDAMGLLGLGPSGRAFVAALGIGVAGSVISRFRPIPVMVLAVCAITPMLPGLTIYRAMFAITEAGSILSGFNLLLQAMGIGLALAAGVSLGEFVASPSGRGAGRWQQMLSRRASGSRI